MKEILAQNQEIGNDELIVNKVGQLMRNENLIEEKSLNC